MLSWELGPSWRKWMTAGAFTGSILACSHSVLHFLICQDEHSGHFVLPPWWVAQPWPPHFSCHSGLMSLKPRAPKKVSVLLLLSASPSQENKVLVPHSSTLSPRARQEGSLGQIHLNTHWSPCSCSSRPCQGSCVHTFTSRWAEWVPGFAACWL